MFQIRSTISYNRCTHELRQYFREDNYMVVCALPYINSVTHENQNTLLKSHWKQYLLKTVATTCKLQNTLFCSNLLLESKYIGLLHDSHEFFFIHFTITVSVCFINHLLQFFICHIFSEFLRNSLKILK